MAESTLSVSFSDLQTRVTRFAGWPAVASWTSTHTADFAIILKHGLRKFYFPPPLEPGAPRHEWSFLYRTGAISLNPGSHKYPLAEDFAGTIIPDSVVYAAGSQLKRLTMADESELEAIRGRVSSNSGTPYYFAVRSAGGEPTGGYRWEMLVYPTPSASGSVKYRYPHTPNTLTSTNQYPVGGAMHGNTIVAAVLSAAEEYLDDDPQGVWSTRFMEALGASIRLDNQAKQKERVV